MRFKKFQIFRHRELLILGIALGFLFFGWNAAEQHLTSFFQEAEGQTAGGLNSLIIYVRRSPTSYEVGLLQKNLSKNDEFK